MALEVALRALVGMTGDEGGDDGEDDGGDDER